MRGRWVEAFVTPDEFWGVVEVIRESHQVRFWKVHPGGAVELTGPEGFTIGNTYWSVRPEPPSGRVFEITEGGYCSAFLPCFWTGGIEMCALSLGGTKGRPEEERMEIVSRAFKRMIRKLAPLPMGILWEDGSFKRNRFVTCSAGALECYREGHRLTGQPGPTATWIPVVEWEREHGPLEGS